MKNNKEIENFLRNNFISSRIDFIQKNNIPDNLIPQNFQFKIDIENNDISQYTSNEIEKLLLSLPNNTSFFRIFQKIHTIDKTKLTEPVIKKAFLFADYHIDNIPSEYHTEENLKFAASNNGCCLDFVKTKNITGELVIAALSSKHHLTLRYIPKRLQTKEIVFEYLKTKLPLPHDFVNYISKKVFNEYKKEIYIQAVSSHYFNIGGVLKEDLTDDFLIELFYINDSIYHYNKNIKDRINILIPESVRTDLVFNKKTYNLNLSSNIVFDTEWIKENIEYIKEASKNSFFKFKFNNFKKDFYQDIENLFLFIDNGIVNLSEDFIKGFGIDNIQKNSKNLYLKSYNKDLFKEFLQEKDFEDLTIFKEELNPETTISFIQGLPLSIQKNTNIVNSILQYTLDITENKKDLNGIFEYMNIPEKQHKSNWQFVNDESTLLLLGHYGFRFKDCPQQFQTKEILNKLKEINNLFIILDENEPYELRQETRYNDCIEFSRPYILYDMKNGFDIDSLIDFFGEFKNDSYMLNKAFFYLSPDIINKILEKVDDKEFYFDILYLNSSLTNNPNYRYPNYFDFIEEQIELTHKNNKNIKQKHI